MVTLIRRQKGLPFLISLLFLIFLEANFSKVRGDLDGKRLDLIHRHSVSVRPTNQLERLKELVHGDTTRYRAISRRIGPRHNERNKGTIRREARENTNTHYNPMCEHGACTSDALAKMPMISGADYGTGQYFLSFKVGSPGHRFRLIMDTGSDLTWMNCKYKCRGRTCNRGSRTLTKTRVFRADHSASFKTVPCSSTMCKVELANLFSLARCPSLSTPCRYDYRYSDGSAATGIFGRETVTFDLINGRKERVHDVLIGCSEFSSGQSFRGADGVLGLGYSKHSFATKATERFGKKFSYCLVDHLSPKNVTSCLIFGHHNTVPIAHDTMQYTKLVLGVTSPFYAVNIQGISLDGTMLGIPVEVWNVNGVGGAIIDSGTSLTLLTRPAYEPVMAILKLSLLVFPRLEMDIGPLEYCFNSTGFDEKHMPRLAFHFTDGTRFSPPVKSYMIDAADGVKCLGFVSTPWPGISVIGNIMQQNHIWEFDLSSSKLGFASSSCT